MIFDVTVAIFGERAGRRREKQPTFEAKDFTHEVFIFFLSAWTHAWHLNENLRQATGVPPWMHYKTPEYLKAIGVDIEIREVDQRPPTSSNGKIVPLRRLDS